MFKYQPYELALSSRLVDVVKAHSIDVLHVHYAIPHAYAAYMAKKMLLDEDISIPIVTTLHGTDITLVGSHPFYRPAVTFSINHSDCVTAVSESLKQDTRVLVEISRAARVLAQQKLADARQGAAQQDAALQEAAVARKAERSPV